MNRLRFVCVNLILCSFIIPNLCQSMPELKLVHVLFTHKLYAPREDDAKKNETSIPEILSYQHFISAALSLPIKAHLNMYNLGVYLRERYGEFLGDIYTSDVMKMHTTEYALSMLSAQLVNAGLWPPVANQIWFEGINWQPIPTEYQELKEDMLLLGSLCPNFLLQMDQVLRKAETQKMIVQYQPLFEHISQYTKRNISTPTDIALLYAALETMTDRNETLPSWAIDVFPHGAMYNVTLLEYDLLSMTSLQKQLNGGTFLKEIFGNSLQYKIGDLSKERKMILYSGDERNIVGVLKNLNLWSPHILNEAAALIFELYFNNNTDMYGMKINYYTGIDGTMIPLTLPNCTEICPLQTLINVTFDLIPENPHSLCGWSVKNFIEKSKIGTSNHNGCASCHSKELLLIFTLLNFALFAVRMLRE